MTTETIKQSEKYPPGKHPNSLAAIQPPPNPIKPGETRNPKGYSVTFRARQKLEDGEVCPYDAQGRKWSETLPDAMLRQALNKVEGMRHLLDRIEGPVTETPAVMVDNRQYNFIVKSDDVKDRLQQLMIGKPKELGNATQ